MAAGVKVIALTRCAFHSLQILAEGEARKLAHVLLLRAGVERIRRVRHEGCNVVRLGIVQERSNVSFVQCLGGAASGVSGEESEGVGAERRGFFAHGQVSARGGNVASDSKHK